MKKNISRLGIGIFTTLLSTHIFSKELPIKYVGNYWSINSDINSLGINKFLETMVKDGKDSPIVVLNTPASSLMGRKVLIRDPKAIKKLFTDYLKEFTTKERSFMAMRRLLGPLALLTSDADEHHNNKKADFTKYFGPANMENFLPIMQKQSSKVLEKWFSEGKIDDLYIQVRDATLGVIKDITFGIEDGDNLEMGKLLENAIKVSASVPLDVYFQALYFQKLQGWYISYAYPEMKEYTDKVHEIIKGLYDQANPDFDTYLNFLKKAKKMGENDAPDDELINDLLTAYLGGHDTTTSFLTFMLEHLAFHPEIQQKIRNEIKEKLSYKLEIGQGIVREDLSKSTMPALDEFIESFAQIVPPVGASGRDVTKNFTLEMDDYAFSFYSGDQLIFPIENVYDTSINEYASNDPEKQIKLSFHNGSPNTCPGQVFAKTEAKVFLILSLWKHELVPMEREKVERLNRGTIVGANPIKIKVNPIL